MLAVSLIATLIVTGPAEAGHYVRQGFLQQGNQQAGVDARQAVLGTPQTIVEVDTDRLKGQVTSIAWPADGKDIYLQTVDKDRQGAVKSTKHYVISVPSKSLKSVGDQPLWALQYHLWKSGLASPASATFKIAVEEREETKRATAAVGALAKGGGGDASGRGGVPGTSAEEAGAISDQSQVVHIWSLKLKGTTLGEWINEGVTPGINWGWAPAPLKLIAFTKRDGGPLMVMDEQGRKQELAGPKNAVLPAWSPDGMKLAWLERKDRKKFDLVVADISAK